MSMRSRTLNYNEESKSTITIGVHNSAHRLQLHSMKDLQYVSSQPNSLITNDITISQHFDLLLISFVIFSYDFTSFI